MRGITILARRDTAIGALSAAVPGASCQSHCDTRWRCGHSIEMLDSPHRYDLFLRAGPMFGFSLVALGAVLGIPSAAFADAPAPTHGPFRVEIADDRTLRDAARGKDVPYRVSFPQDDGQHPLIVFSHGFGGSKDAFATVSRHWASHGYVVIQPTHADGLGRRDGDGNAGGPTRGRLRAGGLLAGLNDPVRIADRVADLVLILDALAEIASERWSENAWMFPDVSISKHWKPPSPGPLFAG